MRLSLSAAAMMILKSRLIKNPTALAVGSSNISKFNEGGS